jgi:hypothetical protein
MCFQRNPARTNSDGNYYQQGRYDPFVYRLPSSILEDKNKNTAKYKG